MEDIEKELGPLIDNYIKRVEESTAKREKRSIENENFKNKFDQLVENVIRPEMYKISQLLVKRGFTSSILHESGHQVGSITLRFSYKESSSNEFIPALYPLVKAVFHLPGKHITSQKANLIHLVSAVPL
jgi:hypothetical protein